MTSYREFIEGYESPEYSEHDEPIIDLDIEERLRSIAKQQKNIKKRGPNPKDPETPKKSAIAPGGGDTS